MPILVQEVSCHPLDLLQGPVLKLPDCAWWAVYTKARQEKSLARDLLSQDIPFYLPLIRKNLLHKGKRVFSHIPLFGGYVFLFGDDAQRLAALKTNRVSQFVAVPHQGELLDDLRSVQTLIASNVPLTIESRLSPGRRVRVKSGAFAGVEGTILDRQKPWRLMVAVNFLQQGVSLEIEDSLLEAID